jgi:uncharacterized protein YraI
MKRYMSSRLSLLLCATILGSQLAIPYTQVYAEPVPVTVQSLVAGGTYTVYAGIPGYRDSYSALTKTNQVTTYAAGSYSIYKIYNGMINITRTPGVPGIWINPAQNPAPAAPAPIEPAPSPAPAEPAPAEPAPAPVLAVKVYMQTTVNLNMRSGPGTGYSIVKTIPKGTAVEIIGTSGSWKKVVYGAYSGWCMGSYLAATSAPVAEQPAPAPVVTAPSEKTYMKTTANLNMRSGAGTGYGIIKVIPKGTTVEVTGSSSYWKNVTYAGITGWCSGNYLTPVSVPQPVLPPAEPSVPPVEPVVPPVEPVVPPVEPVVPPVEPVAPPAEPAPAPLVKKTTSSLNMRTGPGTEFPAITVIPRGTVLEVLEISGYWNKVSYGGNTGWCSGNYMTTELQAVYKLLDVPYVSQLNPTYAPVGCEPASMLMALKSKGFADITYKEFLDDMPKSATNPALGFAGSPYVQDASLRTTIYPKPLAEYANTYAGGRAVDISGATVEDIKKEILAGNPVVVYLTTRLEAPVYATYIVDGESQSLLKNNHVVLVTGYDSENNKLRLTDPWSWDGTRYERWVTVSNFAYSYNIRHHAITVR